MNFQQSVSSKISATGWSSATLVLLTCFLMTACSNKAIYDGMRVSQRNDCLLEPPHLQEDCIAATGMTYEEYKRQREQVIGGK